MISQTWQLPEMLGHLCLAWTTVVVLIGGWLLLAQPRQAAIRYAGWLLATFAGAVFLPMMVCVGPLTSWEQVTGSLRQELSIKPEARTTFRSRSQDELDSAISSTTTVGQVARSEEADRGVYIAEQRITVEPISVSVLAAKTGTST